MWTTIVLVTTAGIIVGLTIYGVILASGVKFAEDNLFSIEEPHASDCSYWVKEPCDCITGKTL